MSSKILSPFLMLPAALAVLVLSGCGKSPAPPAAEPEKAAAETAQPAPAQDAAAAELATKEEELAKREADVALKEREAEVARREAELAAKESAARKQAAAKTAVAKPATTTTAAAPVAAKTSPPPAPKSIVVPAGTALSAELITPLSTKTARKGDRFQAKLSAPVMVDGQTAVPAGALVEGYVVEKVSGSKEIGAIPSLTLTFDKLVPTPDYSVAISGQLVQAGKSEAGADTAKIAGGAIAGAIIGHQVNKDKGSIIGGVLGAAAGTAAAKNTGAEVELPAGTPVGFVLNSAVEVKP